MNCIRYNSIAVLGVALALGACAKSDNSATTNDSAAGAMAASDSSAMANNTPATPALTDANIVAILDGANVADSTAGKLASTKGTSSDVVSYGKMMMGEHHALRVAGQSFAKKDMLTPTLPANDNGQATADANIRNLTDTPKGAAWDKAYIDNEVAYHEAVLKTAGDAKNATQNLELKALIDKAAPVVQKHLDRAKEIQKKLTPAT
jgi:putative membrane protein